MRTGLRSKAWFWQAHGDQQGSRATGQRRSGLVVCILRTPRAGARVGCENGQRTGRPRDSVARKAVKGWC